MFLALDCNRASLSGAKHKSYGYAPEANRLVRVGRKGLSYDPRGNLLADGNGRRAFAYDVTNRLAGYSKDGALRASYRYNAFGQRVTKTLYGREEGTARTLNFAYTPEGWLLSEIGRKQNQEAGSASDWETRNERLFTDEYIWLGGRPLAKLTRRINANGVTKRPKSAISTLTISLLRAVRRMTMGRPYGSGIATALGRNAQTATQMGTALRRTSAYASPVNTMTARVAYTTTTTATMTLKRAVTSNPTR